MTSSFESEHSFEDIGRRLVHKSSLPLKTLIPAVVMLLGLIITLIDRVMGDTNNLYDIMLYAILFSFFAVLTILNKQDSISFVISNLQGTAMFSSSPSKAEVSDFLDILKAKQKTYLLNRYAVEDPYISPEQVANDLKWLYDRDVINEAELEDLRYQLLERPKLSKDSMPFNFSPN